VIDHASVPRIPASTRAARILRMPFLMRPLDGSLGLTQERRHLHVGVAIEKGELNRTALFVGELFERPCDLIGLGNVPHLVMQVVRYS
jgi:hypothetical protein